MKNRIISGKTMGRLLWVILLFVLLFSYGGNAQSNFYFSMYKDKNFYYPGDIVQINISGDYEGSKGGTKSYTLNIYKLDIQDVDQDYETVIKGKNPYKKIPGTLSFKNSGGSWCYGEAQVKIPALPEGCYYIRGECGGQKTGDILTVTRLGITAKTDGDKILIYVQDQKTSKPQPQTKVTVKTGQGTKTEIPLDNNGMGIINIKDIPGYKTGEYLTIDGVLNDSCARTPLYPGGDGQTLKGYIFTDRPIYRPEQKVNIKGILRFDKKGDLTLIRDSDVEYKITDPNGAEVKKGKLKTDQYGNVSTDFLLEEEPPLGTYYINFTLQGQTATGNFSVEEYRKPEFEIMVKPHKDWYVQGDKVNVEVLAKYYFGSPVPDTDFTYYVVRNYYYPVLRKSSGWWIESDRYYGRGYGYSEQVSQGTGKTDKEGKAQISFDAMKWEYDANYSIVVKMVDKSRREVTGSGGVKVTKGEFYFNAQADRYFCEVGKAVNIKINSADYQQNPLSVDFNIKIIRHYYTQSKSLEKESLSQDLKTDQNGLKVFTFKPDQSGYYRVVISGKDSKKNSITTETNFYASTRNDYDWYTFTNMDIMTDKDYYHVGDTAEMLLVNPQKDTHVLLTVEGEKIYQQKVIYMQGNSCVFSLPIEEDFAPNVYVTMTYFKDGQSYYFTKKIVVPNKKFFLTLNIQQDKEKYKPRDTASFTVTTLDYKGNPVSSQITLAVADESVFAVMPDSTPNIQKFFLGTRENQSVTWTSIYGYTGEQKYLYDYGDEEMSPKDGGIRYKGEMTKEKKAMPTASARADRETAGAPEAEPQMVQPELVREYFPDTCYFNPNIISDQNGKATVNVLLPDSLTTWRATARAISHKNHVGESTSKIIVTKNLLVRLIAPRFLTERDESLITGIIHNYLQSPKKVQSEMTIEGMKMTSQPKVTISVPKDGSEKIDWKVKAEKIGTAKMTLKGLTDEESDAMELKINILPHGTEKYSAGAGDTEDKAELELTLPEQSHQNSATIRIQVSPSIAGGMLSALEYLIGYPYGCVEQTMSRFLPTIIVQKTLRDLDIFDEKMNQEIPKMVQKGLERLYNFHHNDGGWGWWENDQSHPYMTAYVVFGLSRAKALGYQIREDKLQAGIQWLLNNYPKEKDINTKAYMLYSLSVAGTVKKDWSNSLYNQRDQLNNYARAILCMALNTYGEKDKALNILRLLEKKAETTGTQVCWKGMTGSHGWTDNEIETTAYVLMAFLQVEPTNPMVGKAVRYLSVSRKGAQWYSTKDTSAAIMALTEYVKYSKEMSPDYSGTITVNGKKVQDFTFSKKDVSGKGVELVIPGKDLLSGKNKIVFEKKGKGKLYYTAYLKYYSTEENIKAQEAGFRVKREYFLINPNVKENSKKYLTPLTDPEIKLYSQDLIRVKLTITGNSHYEYVIIEDPKPAGCEVADTITEDRYSWRYWYAQREVRDEKTAFFVTNFYKGTQTLEYTLRAETPGYFHVMPCNVSLMYIPEIGGISDEVHMKIMEKEGKASGVVSPDDDNPDDKNTDPSPDNNNTGSQDNTTASTSQDGFWDNLYSLVE